METRFVRDLANKPRNIHYKFDPTVTTVNRNGLDKDDMIVAATTIRRFLDPGTDKISLDMISAVFEMAPIDVQHKNDLREISKTVKDFLKMDARLMLQTPKSNRTIVENMIYGYILHDNVTKEKTIEEWQKNPAQWEEIWHAFEHCMAVLAACMKVTKDFNVAVLDKYG